MRDGILILDKPREWTSSDCVALCRGALKLKGVKKIGHGGTLDPMAEGLLPIFIGQTTRIMEYMDLDYKTYLCRVRLGITTDTQDVWGEILEEKTVEGITEVDIRNVIGDFCGTIEQLPPAYSAVRIEGKHLYEYARAGRDPARDVEPRRVHIERIEVLEVDMEAGTVAFEVKCSKGTYVRTICHDLGRKLGCGAAMEYLKRTAIGDLDLRNSISPVDIKEMSREEFAETAERLMISPDRALKRFGEIRLNKERADYFRRGNSTAWVNVRVAGRPKIAADPRTGQIPLNARGRSYDRIYRVYEEGTGEFLGTGYEDREERLLKADKVFRAR